MMRQDAIGASRPDDASSSGSLADVRVIELGDEIGEYCGMVLAGLGAEVIKVEPRGGARTRTYEPFYQDNRHPERSLYFWAMNRGKRSIELDLAEPDDAQTVRQLLSGADVLIDSTPRGALDAAGLSTETICADFPALVHARMTHFGDHGPWADWDATDLVHLALGGVAMNCGYDPDPHGDYKLPPVAPQAAHSYAIAGEQVAFSIIAALCRRDTSGTGQQLTCAVHEAVAKNTEGDVMSWVALRTPFLRQTSRHSATKVSSYWTIAPTLDGRWILALSRDTRRLGPFLRDYGLGGEVKDADTEEERGSRVLPGTESGAASNMDAVTRMLRRYRYEDVPWREAQDVGLMWVPVRKPHENAQDEHWLSRASYTEVDHPEIGRRLLYPTSKWIASASGWVTGRRAPQLDEDRAEVLATLGSRRASVVRRTGQEPERKSKHGRPFALQGVRILDFTWYLASAGATRFLAALGAEVIKVEWKDNLDPRRGGAPVGGRAAREVATGPVPSRWPADLGGPVGAQYNNKNPGKKGISLNVRDPRGLELAKRLVAQCDVVTNGFSPGVMERWGLGYEVLSEINPSVIYAKQSGMGSYGTYGRFRSVGPVAAAFSGLTDMSGLPEPHPPAGWGYSYLDWYGAYSFALALTTAIYHRMRTGEGQWIDASQCEVGLFLGGVPVLDWEANGRSWSRPGNRSPHQIAAPEGIYRTRGDDRWIAISCLTDEHWSKLVEVAEHPEWTIGDQFATGQARRDNRAALDHAIEHWTVELDGSDLMNRLQGAGVPAGITQTAEDRVEHDPQLRELQWLTELDATDFGRWPVAESSVRMSATPPYAGGMVDAGAPTYGEHNHQVYGDLLGLSAQEVDALAEEGVL